MNMSMNHCGAGAGGDEGHGGEALWGGGAATRHNTAPVGEQFSIRHGGLCQLDSAGVAYTQNGSTGRKHHAGATSKGGYSRYTQNRAVLNLFWRFFGKFSAGMARRQKQLCKSPFVHMGINLIHNLSLYCLYCALIGSPFARGGTVPLGITPVIEEGGRSWSRGLGTVPEHSKLTHYLPGTAVDFTEMIS